MQDATPPQPTTCPDTASSDSLAMAALGATTLSGRELRFTESIEPTSPVRCELESTRLAIEAGARIEAGALLRLEGGLLTVGAGARIGREAEVALRGQVTIGPGTIVEPFVRIDAEGGAVQIGGAARIGRFSHLWAHNGPIRIGAECALGQSSTWIGTGEGVHVAARCDFTHQVTLDSAGGRIDMGPRSGVGPGSVLYGHGGLRIGGHCAIAGLTMLVAGNHRFARRDVPIREQGVEGLPILVEDDVWIGGGVVVLGGATIRCGAVIAAGAVVRGEIAPGVVAGGVPARVLGRRDEASGSS